MKLKNLVQSTQALLDTKSSKLKSKKKELKKLVRQLREKEQSLAEDLACEGEESKRRKIKRKAALAHSQRKKGLEALKALKKD